MTRRLAASSKALAAVAILWAGQAQAQCIVEEAAQAALDREIALIEALATDVDEIFNGPNGCIDASIFQEFDLSIAIPDLAGMLTSAATNLITDAINAAQTKVCQEINNAIDGTIGEAQTVVNNFSSGLSDELQNALDNGWESLEL